jgi:uncharacterized coiled-coil DUF342 family protein
MRGTNGPMDVITRAEFDHSMKDFPTKDALVSAVREAIRENLDDLKIDLSAQLEEKVTKSHNLLGLSAVRTSDLKDAKNEILATMRRNIGEAIEPLKADLHNMGARLDKMGARVDEMHATFKSVADGHKGLDEKLTRLGNDIRNRLDRHEGMLDRHDADLYKLRQSGVLQ